jgi:formylglycine-generating enzyme required for sulfatase activity
MAGLSSSDKLKVFISYSRRDSSEFVDELLKGLRLLGFAPFLDRNDIVPGEPWEERLEELIREADTVVFVISPEAVKSKRCRWEIDKAIALPRRLMPVVFKPVPEAEIPEQLGPRQFARFDAGAGFVEPLGRLAEALRQDLDWIREHTWMGERAGRWEARARPVSLLLPGEDIAAAQAWAERRKADAPVITELMRAFIEASKQAESARLRRNRVITVLIGVLVMFLVAGAVAWWNQDRLKEQVSAWTKVAALEIYAWTNVTAINAAQERALKSLDSFKECRDCPEMVVVPAGSFTMGSPAGQGSEEERPAHNVTIGLPFAVSKFEVTFSEWAACTVYGRVYCTQDYGTVGERPVDNLTWEDAQNYVGWLSRITGKTYRLLSEAEYEYAARAGTTTIYPWGDDIKLNGQAMANCRRCGSKWDGEETAPVGSFAPNNFGLYDMIGNASEWIEDCGHLNYEGAPVDGSAWISGNCKSRMIRGGSYKELPSTLRVVSRQYGDTGARDQGLGFRVARTLNTP